MSSAGDYDPPNLLSGTVRDSRVAAGKLVRGWELPKTRKAAGMQMQRKREGKRSSMPSERTWSRLRYTDRSAARSALFLGQFSCQWFLLLHLLPQLSELGCGLPRCVTSVFGHGTAPPSLCGDSIGTGNRTDRRNPRYCSDSRRTRYNPQAPLSHGDTEAGQNHSRTLGATSKWLIGKRSRIRHRMGILGRSLGRVNSPRSR